jgi:hypothetical protein
MVMTCWKPARFVLYYHAFRIISLSAVASAFFVVHRDRAVMILAAGLIPVLSNILIRAERNIYNKAQKLFSDFSK